MKLAAIDIGTNSMRLLIATYENGVLFNRKKLINTTRIGQDVDKEGYISDEAIKRNIDALDEFVKIAKEENCVNIYCMGTSALRDSKNKYDFINIAKRKLDIDIEILSGDEEAELGFKGVLSGFEKQDNILVIDIGGGSTEFIVGNENEIEFSKSIDIGALRMTEKFLKEDPIQETEFYNMSQSIENSIKTTINILKKKKISKLVGIGGTITSVSSINQKLEIYSMDKVHNSKIFIKDLEDILQNIKNMTVNNIKKIVGLQEKRADIIVAGVKILEIIMRNLEIENIIVSEYDNLEGLLCKKIKKLS